MLESAYRTGGELAGGQRAGKIDDVIKSGGNHSETCLVLSSSIIHYTPEHSINLKHGPTGRSQEARRPSRGAKARGEGSQRRCVSLVTIPAIDVMLRVCSLTKYTSAGQALAEVLKKLLPQVSAGKKVLDLCIE